MPTYQVLRPLKIDGRMFGPPLSYSRQPSSGETIEMSAVEAKPYLELGVIQEERPMTTRKKKCPARWRGWPLFPLYRYFIVQYSACASANRT
jgi:hypothetical protein